MDTSNFSKKTISINNLTVREAQFEYKDRNGNPFTIRQIFFEPVEIGPEAINMNASLQCKPEEYSALKSDIEEALLSVEIYR